MSVRHIALLLLLAACNDGTTSKLSTKTKAAAAMPTAAAVSVRVPQAAPDSPRLPPPPLERRAHVMITAPAIPCDGVKVRLYADGKRRSCMVATREKPDKDSYVVVSCGARAELPSEIPLKLELRYERGGIELARVDLGTETLEVGDQALAGRTLAYSGDIARLCPAE
jgi:hypothetical protein